MLCRIEMNVSTGVLRYLDENDVEIAQPVDVELVRARNADGTYVGDDPATPANEAWVEVSIGQD
jgi:hypothetical protein